VHLADFAVRAAGDPKQLVKAIQNQVWGVDQDQTVTNVRTMEEVISASTAPQRFEALLLGVFATLALALAVIGIYGVVSYSVGHRIHVIGIRMALGARQGDVLRMVLGGALRLALIGIAVGLGASLILARFLRSLLFAVGPTDPATLGAVSLVFACVALLASYIPARRATKVDPMEALRHE
jgi:putative ABC transport system permease protein